MVQAHRGAAARKERENAMRADDTRVKNLTSIVKALPCIMPRRYDARKRASGRIDEDIVKTYIRRKRREGRRVTRMSVPVAASALENPKADYFIRNWEACRRNRLCFSSKPLKKRADGTPDEMTRMAFGFRPRRVIDSSPFHTGLFVTNPESINTRCIHHGYEFDATGALGRIGKPVRRPEALSGERERVIPLGGVRYERIAAGIEYSRFFETFSRNMRNPETLETRLDGIETAAVAASAVGIGEVAL
jgi:hypothetical protein